MNISKWIFSPGLIVKDTEVSRYFGKPVHLPALPLPNLKPTKALLSPEMFRYRYRVSPLISHFPFPVPVPRFKYIDKYTT